MKIFRLKRRPQTDFPCSKNHSTRNSVINAITNAFVIWLTYWRRFYKAIYLSHAYLYTLVRCGIGSHKGGLKAVHPCTDTTRREYTLRHFHPFSELKK